MIPKQRRFLARPSTVVLGTTSSTLHIFSFTLLRIRRSLAHPTYLCCPGGLTTMSLVVSTRMLISTIGKKYSPYNNLYYRRGRIHRNTYLCSLSSLKTVRTREHGIPVTFHHRQ